MSPTRVYKENTQELLSTFLTLKESIVKTIMFYVNNGDLVSAAFITCVFYEVVSIDELIKPEPALAASALKVNATAPIPMVTNLTGGGNAVTG